MNPEVIAREYLIELDLQRRALRQEKIDFAFEIKQAVIYGYTRCLQEEIQTNTPEK